MYGASTSPRAPAARDFLSPAPPLDDGGVATVVALTVAGEELSRITLASGLWDFTQLENQFHPPVTLLPPPPDATATEIYLAPFSTIYLNVITHNAFEDLLAEELLLNDSTESSEEPAQDPPTRTSGEERPTAVEKFYVSKEGLREQILIGIDHALCRDLWGENFGRACEGRGASCTHAMPVVVACPR